MITDPQGTGGRARELGRPLAGKTGTTNEQADAWFIGYSPDVITGVWVGHDESRFLGWGETGARAALPIWMEFMHAALDARPARDFPVPESIVFARVDRKTGLLADASSTNSVFQAYPRRVGADRERARGRGHRGRSAPAAHGFVLSSSDKGPVPGSASELLVRRAAAPAAAPPREAQSLLAAAVARLRERTRCEIAVAWAPRPDGAPDVAAASSDGAPPLDPERGRVRGGDPPARAPARCSRSESNPTLRGIAARHGLAAAAPVTGADGRALAVLLTGAPNGAAARPRELAALTAAAQAARAPARRGGGGATARPPRQRGETARSARGAGTADPGAGARGAKPAGVGEDLPPAPARAARRPGLHHALPGAWRASELERTLRLLELVIDYPGAAGRAGASPRAWRRRSSPCWSCCSRTRASAASRWRRRRRPRKRAVALGGDGLRQVLLNLLLNAIDATPRGAAVSVATRALPAAVELVVSDAGAGIAPELRERVFEPFFTTRGVHHGGIGLAIARGLVEQAGGRIRVRAAAGGGAAFVVVLPVPPVS